MSVVPDGPTQSVLTRVVARPLSPGESLHGYAVDLFWSAPDQGDRLVQVYVDGALTDTAVDAHQRSMLLLLPTGVPRRIELLAVPVGDAAMPHTELLKAVDPPLGEPPALALLRDPGAGVGERVCVEIEGLLRDEAPLYGPRDARSGFGSVFGVGGFGTDAATGPGLGLGELGDGPLGADGQAWRWRNPDLPAGGYELSVSIKDAEGRTVSQSLGVEADFERLPPPVESLSLSQTLELTWM